MGKKKREAPESYNPSAVKLNHLLAGDFMMDLHDFMYARMERVDPDKMSREFGRLKEEADLIFDLIKEVLPEEMSGKLIDLCDAYTGMGAAVSELYYRRGFSDGVMVVLQAMMAAG